MEDYAQQMGRVLHILSSAVQSGWEFYRLFEYENIFIFFMKYINWKYIKLADIKNMPNILSRN